MPLEKHQANTMQDIWSWYSEYDALQLWEHEQEFGRLVQSPPNGLLFILPPSVVKVSLDLQNSNIV